MAIGKETTRTANCPQSIESEILREPSETQRHQPDERFRAVFENAGTGIAITDGNGFLQQCNRAYCEMLGYSEEELRQIHPLSLIHPEDQQENQSRTGQLQRGAVNSFAMDNRYVRKDGRAIWVRTIASTVPADSGKTSYWVATVTDITELKEAEKKIRENSERLRAIMNTASDAIVTINNRGIIDNINMATESMFGYSSAELVGQNVSILMPHPYRAQHDGFIQKFLDTGEAHILGVGREVICQRKDGSTFPADLAVSQVDHLGLFTGVLRDISSRKQMQKHILEIVADEQRRIGLELHDGTQQELTGLTLYARALLETIQSASRLEADGKSIWQFAESKYERLQHTASLLSKRLSEANQHVRDLSHGIMPVQVDGEGLRSALGELADSIDSHENVHCSFECTGKFEMANNTAATHLFRIAQEAVNNALKHGMADNIEIKLYLQRERITLEVSDNGRGFDASSVSELNASSMGMGLRTMEYRASLIGGVFQIKAQPEGGTLVRCTVLQEVVFDE